MKKLWLFGIVFLLCVAQAMALGYNVTQVGNATAAITEGNTTSTRFIDGDLLNISEVVGAPAFDLRFNVTGMGVGPSDYIYIYLNTLYIGNPAHEVYMEFYNYTHGDWNVLGDRIPSGTTFENYSYYAKGNDSRQGGILQLRLYHTSPGNTNHYLSVDRLIVRETDTEPVVVPELEYQPTVCPINSVQSTMLYIFIGLLLIGFAVWASYTSILFFSIIVGFIGIIYGFPLFGCSPVYGLVVVLGSLFYILYEAFFRKFQEK